MVSIALFIQQLRIKFGSLFFWSLIWCLLILLFAAVFNSLSKDAAENAKVFESLPKEVFSAINIDPTLYLTSIEKFISGQFLFIYLLAGSIFSFSLGVGAIGKKIENGSIANLLTKQISRGKIYIGQLLVNSAFLILSGLIVGSFMWFAFNALLTNAETISGSYFFWLSFGSTLLFITFSALGQLLGMLLNGGKAVTIGAGIVVVSWFLSTLGAMVNLPVWVQGISLFHYFDIAMLRDEFALNVGKAIVLLIFLVIFSIVGWLNFKKKDIYV